jgi:hypothetical protein
MKYVIVDSGRRVMSVWNTGNGKFEDVNVGVEGIYDELLSYGIEDGAACDVTNVCIAVATNRLVHSFMSR